MASFHKRGDSRGPKHVKPDTLQFSMFTSDHIQKLAVANITSPLTFDVLGYPLTGGLYDKRLGPISEKSDPCSTCFKNVFSCPGHFGYIELPLPVVNPLFHKVLCSIIKKTCLMCYHIQAPSYLKTILGIQVKLLDHGLVSEAIDLQSHMYDLMIKYDKSYNIPEKELLKIMDYEKLIKMDNNDSLNRNRNTEGLKNQFLGSIWEFSKTSKVCLNCKVHLRQVVSLNNKLIIIDKEMVKESSDYHARSVVKSSISKHVTPEQCRYYLRKIWDVEKDLLLQIIPVLSEVELEYPTDVLFFDIIPVPPNNVRPVNIVDGMLNEHPQTRVYKRLLQDSILLRAIVKVIKNADNVEVLSTEARSAYDATKGDSALEKLSNIWESLQQDVNSVMDYEGRLSGEQGLKQIIEKKSGVIRMHMMGKRVNYAARSVITPDPNLRIEEIGVPEAFATHLTYPVPVTSWNVEELRKLITNGPKVHPGAVMVEFENGMISRIDPTNETQQKALLKRLLTPDGPEKGFKGLKIVHRHLQNGDILLLNRQPTLHRPSIMAHTARILKHEKTLRLHYANCKAYNADFDGDEMNAHFPQNEVARSEGYFLANVANQYLVPKDGTPLSGLIQDHMVAGVRMSLRGVFFTKTDYQHLVYQALSNIPTQIKLLPPSVLKPQVLWSGKQIISTVLLNVITKGRFPLNLTSSAKISEKAWQTVKPRKWKAGGTRFTYDKCMTEAEVIIRQGELLVGVLDKSHYGATPYSLVHCMHELYGGSVATKLLSSLAILFTSFLQIEGFTLGVHDILVLSDADETRRNVIEKSRLIGPKTMCKALNLSSDLSPQEILNVTEKHLEENEKIRSIIDREYKSALDTYTNNVNKACLPAGLICSFPKNNLQLMVQSGAKGSTVNTMQISCMLGQIELEGKRPPLMISGKSLPSFPAIEFSPRAGGYVDGRFMTGIQPQEFFFHCMAGREGLIDTAVKTSRSGYLQRCLIKHLEGLSVAYDMTVRDSDRSVIQFQYGEDGMDISKAQFLNSQQLGFLKENVMAIINDDAVAQLEEDSQLKKVRRHIRAVKRWMSKHKDPFSKRPSAFAMFSETVKPKVKLERGNEIDELSGRTIKTSFVVDLWRSADLELKQRFLDEAKFCPDPVTSLFQADAHFGVLNERLQELIDNTKEDGIKKMLKVKSIESVCSAGEPVGLLAAQSIGEPSTQMTLNTFHFAGRGEMNVTLGIPRLREILMMASKNIKTPSMEVPFLGVPNVEAKAEKLCKIMTRLVVADVLEYIHVVQVLETSPIRQHKYTLRFQFIPSSLYKRKFNVKPKGLLRYMETVFFKLMFAGIRKAAKVKSSLASSAEESKKKSHNNADNEESEEVNNVEANLSSDEEPEDEEDAKTNFKYQQVHDNQEAEVDNDELDENEDNLNEDFDGNENDDEKAERNDVVDTLSYANSYSYDKKHHSWCELTFSLPLTFVKVDMTAVLKEVASKAVVWETPGIRRAITYMNDGRLTLRTDGINFHELFKYNQLLDLNCLYSNDIHQVANTYGVEAATKVIVKEVRDVFKVYGITVDPRHLLLIADYMTYSGQFEPLSRKGMESSASPLQQISFESSLTFLKSATINGKLDALRNPSSCLMVGKPCNVGTGVFGLLQKLTV